MPSFDTPEPISATITLARGDVHISAGDRNTTTVEVRPSDESKAADARKRAEAELEQAKDPVDIARVRAALQTALMRERIATRRNTRFQDQVLEVLVEEQVKGRWRGRSPGNRLVFFEDQQNWAGRLAQVRIDQTGPWALVGSLVGERTA